MPKAITVIAPRQLMILTIMLTLGDAILIVPSFLGAEARQDAWISAVLSLGLGLLIVWLYSRTAAPIPGVTLGEGLVQQFGRYAGGAMALAFLLVFLPLLAASLLREVGDFSVTQNMPETPVEVIMLLFLLVAYLAARLGLETISRTAEVLFPWVLLLFAVFLAAILPQIAFTRLEPVFEHGAGPILHGVYTHTAIPYLELSVLLVIFPFVRNPAKARLGYGLGTLAGGICMVAMITLCTMVLGADRTTRALYPPYILAKKISIGHFIERVEALIAIIWLMTIFFKMTVCYYASALGLARLLRLADYRPLLLPLAFLLYYLAIHVADNIVDFNRFTREVWPLFAAIFALALPAALLGRATLRKREGPREKAPSVPNGDSERA